MFGFSNLGEYLHDYDRSQADPWNRAVFTGKLRWGFNSIQQTLLQLKPRNGGFRPEDFTTRTRGTEKAIIKAFRHSYWERHESWSK